MRVCFIFRKKNERFFSIEKVFAVIMPALQKSVSISEVNVPYYTNGLVSVGRNMLSVFRSFKADIYHITGDVHYLALALPASRTVLTIHDCVFLHNSSGIKRRVLKWLLLDMPVKRAAVVTTISENSRNEIIRFSQCDPSKVVVVPNAVSDQIQYAPADFNEQKPVILFIGSTRNKNLERIIPALQDISCHLLMIGKPDDELHTLLSASGIDHSIYSGLSEQELAEKYNQCDIVLFPSTYEGFGLPVIEGQKAGRVVITSNLSPMKEVAGDGACLVDPFNVDSIQNAVMKVISDKRYRDQLIERGFVNAGRYHPSAIAGQFIALYKRLSNR